MNLLGLKAALTLDMDDYERGLGKAEKRAGIFAEVLKANLVTKGAEVAIKGLARLTDAATKLVGDIVSSYADYEQLAGGVETLFGDSADKVKGYADRAFQTAGLSANEYMETVTSFSASLIQSMGGDTAKAADMADMAITDMADNANKMGTDMSSIQTAYAGFAKQNYTMLDNLKLGYGGTKTEMDRLIKDAAKLDKSFKATEKTVTKNGKNTKELAYSYADVVKAIHIVQTNMGITGTTAKEATTTIEGSIKQLKAAWQNLLTGVGSGDQMQIHKLVQNVVASAETALKNLIPVIKNALQGLGTLVRDLAPVVGRELPGLAADLLPAALDALAGLVDGLFAGLPGFIRKGVPILIRAIGESVNGIMKALPQLGAKLMSYLKNDLMPDIAWAIAEASGGGWEEANSIYHGMNSVLDTFTGWFEKVGKGIKDVYDTYISPAFQAIGTWLVDTMIPKLGELWTAIGNLFSNLGTTIDAFLKTDAGIWLTDTFASMWSGIQTELELFVKFLTEVFSGEWESAWQTLADMVALPFNALVDLVKVPINGVIDLLNSMITATVNAINDLIDLINSIPLLPNLSKVEATLIGHIGQKPGAGRDPKYKNRRASGGGGSTSGGGRGRYFANGGILNEGEEAWVGEYAPERLKVVNGRAVVTPVSSVPGRFKPTQPQPERPTYVIIEMDGMQKMIYKLNKAEEQRVGVKLAK